MTTRSHTSTDINAAPVQTADHTDPVFNYRVVLGFVNVNEGMKKNRAGAYQNQIGAEAHSKVIGIPTVLKKEHEGIAEQAKGQVAFYDAHIIDVSANPQQWTRADLTKLATTNVEGVAAFDALVFLRVAAKETDLFGNFTKKAGTAQQALAQFMPKQYGNATQNLIHFIQDIDVVNVATENHPVRVAAHAKASPAAIPPSNKVIQAGGKTGALFDADKGIKINPLDNKSFDQKAAQAILTANGVQVDSNQSLKTPTFEEAALAAVKNLKAQSAVIAA